ncbi:helix-turn-helix domain-containing protein [Mesorhizobium montanum]|uniref:helix-turn-helix domain-containing protein n=1 Tax=Mesorhizobium montanum TaxID=3072323 RepID=UPI003221D785
MPDLIETRSFNRTSDRLGVTQSTLSSRIRTLEGLLGKQLFIRSVAEAKRSSSGRRASRHVC